MDPIERSILDAISPTKHVLQRTSPKGQAFVGTCVRCGQGDLPAVAAKDPCTARER